MTCWRYPTCFTCRAKIRATPVCKTVHAAAPVWSIWNMLIPNLTQNKQPFTFASFPWRNCIIFYSYLSKHLGAMWKYFGCWPTNRQVMLFWTSINLQQSPVSHAFFDFEGKLKPFSPLYSTRNNNSNNTILCVCVWKSNPPRGGLNPGLQQHRRRHRRHPARERGPVPSSLVSLSMQ